MDPILEYLLELNEKTALEYSDRYLIPPGGLAKLLDGFNGFHLNRVEVIKSEITSPSEPKKTQTTEEELYALLD